MTKKKLSRKKLNNSQVKSYIKAVKKGLKSQHVVLKQNGWAVKRAGATRASKIFDTQKQAIRHAQRISKKQKSGLFVHSADGRIKSRGFSI